LREITSQLAGFFGARTGLLVVSVVKGSPADQSGLRTGDVIVGAGDQDTATLAGLREILSTQKGLISFKVVRDKSPMVISIVNQ
jgi:S1-C subfamily serine protease